MFKRPNPLRRAPHSSSRAGPSARQQSSDADRPRPPSQSSLDGAVSFFGRFSMDRPPSRRQDSASSSTVSPTEQQAMEVNEHETASSYFAQTFVTAQEDGSQLCTSPLETPAASPPASPTAPPGPPPTRIHLTLAQVQELRKLRRDLCEAFVTRHKMVANRVHQPTHPKTNQTNKCTNTTTPKGPPHPTRRPKTPRRPTRLHSQPVARNAIQRVPPCIRRAVGGRRCGGDSADGGV